MYTNNQYGHRDHLGNIREVLDANGAVCQYTDYFFEEESLYYNNKWYEKITLCGDKSTNIC